MWSIRLAGLFATYFPYWSAARLLPQSHDAGPASGADLRSEQLHRGLQGQFGTADSSMADASSRRYFRRAHGIRTWSAIDAPSVLESLQPDLVSLISLLLPAGALTVGAHT